MTLPPNYQNLIESWQPVAGKPYLQPLVVPKTSRYDFWQGFRINGVIPYNMCTWTTWISPRVPWSIQKPLIAPPYISASTRVFVGKSPNRGIYTGVK